MLGQYPLKRRSLFRLIKSVNLVLNETLGFTVPEIHTHSRFLSAEKLK